MNDKLRITFVTSWNAKCGIAEYSRYLVDAIGEQAQCFIVADHCTNPIRTDDDSVRRCWNQCEWTAADVEATVEKVKLTRPHIVSIQFPIFYFTGAPGLQRMTTLLQDSGIRVCITLHSPWDNPEVVEALRHLDAVIAHRPSDLTRLQELGLRHSHHQSQGIAVFAPEPAVSNTRSNAFTVSTFGFFLPHKGIFEIIAAFRWARRIHPSLRLRILSSLYPQNVYKPYVDFCIDWIRKQGLASHVELWTTFLDERQIVSQLASSDLVVLAYTHTQEASSAAIRMPLASMTPVLCSDLPIFDEVGEAVHRFPAGNTVELARSIFRFASDPEHLRSRIDAQTRMVHNMSWPRVARRFLDIVSTTLKHSEAAT